MYTISGQNTWHSVTNEGAHTWGRLIFPLSVVNRCLRFLLAVGPFLSYPFLINMSIGGVGIVRELFMQPDYWSIMEFRFPIYSRKPRSHRRLPGPLPVTVFPLALPQCSLSLGSGNSAVGVFKGAEYLMINCSLHFEQLWFYVRVSLMQRESSLMRGLELCLSVGIKISTYDALT